MKIVKYRKYTGEPADEVDLDELMKRLGDFLLQSGFCDSKPLCDFLLQSGFESQYYGLSEFDAAQSMEALRDAILRALQEGELIPEDLMSDELQQILQDPGALNNQHVRDLIEKIIQRFAGFEPANAGRIRKDDRRVMAGVGVHQRTVLLQDAVERGQEFRGDRPTEEARVDAGDRRRGPALVGRLRAEHAEHRRRQQRCRRSLA